MSELSDEPRDLLNQALDKAQHLVDELRRQQADLESRPPKLEPGQIAAGREALARAIAAAQKTVENVQTALRRTRSLS